MKGVVSSRYTPLWYADRMVISRLRINLLLVQQAQEGVLSVKGVVSSRYSLLWYADRVVISRLRINLLPVQQAQEGVLSVIGVLYFNRYCFLCYANRSVGDIKV